MVLKGIRTLIKLDEKGLSYFENISIEGMGNYKTNIEFLTHPSTHFYEKNIAKRKLGIMTGLAAQDEIIKHVL